MKSIEASQQQTSTNRWNAKQREFQLWLATPPSDRAQDLQQQFAAHINVDETTLVRWKHMPGFLEEVRALALPYLNASLAKAYATFGKRLEQEARLEDLRFAHQLLGYPAPDSSEKIAAAAASSVVLILERSTPSQK